MASTVPIFKNERTTLERLEKFVSKEYFTDCNLRGKLYLEKLDLDEILHADFGQNRVSFCEAKRRLNEGEAKNVKEGLSISPTWSTHWFKLVFKVPESLSHYKHVHLLWDAECEAMVWSRDGCPLQGLSGDVGRIDFRLPSNNPPEEIYIEVACNGLFGAGNNGFINAPDPDKRFTLKSAKIAVFNEDAFQLLMDFDILIGLCKCLPNNNTRRFDVMYFANNLVNEFIKDSTVESLQNLHKLVEGFLNVKNDNVKEDTYKIFAVGNCHIDSAWLWPYDETKRKCGRSWSSTVALMEEYPDLLTFACSQAQQLEWVQHNYPDLFMKLLLQAKKERFVPVGGCWVEMDGNLPGGESFVRQILYGQKYFLENFGRICTEFWLPDTFGYSAQLPQLMTQGGMRRFVTQKMSWSLVNKFPHNTFWWRGIDGTRVLTHFPPGDDYCMNCTVEDVTKSVNNFRDKGRSNCGLMLYGKGDGGGGPDREMLERLRRLKNAPECPVVVAGKPSDFFESLENSNLHNLCTWDGELYLELHNGTYTTQANVKKMNRKMEFLLRDCEFLSVITYLCSKGSKIRLWNEEWKKILLNQFHDVLPGSSIGSVYKDAQDLYLQVAKSCEDFLQSKNATDEAYANFLAWPRFLEIGDNRIVVLPPSSVTNKPKFVQFEKPSVAVIGSNFVLENKYIKAVINNNGLLVNLFVKGSKVPDSSFGFVPAGRYANEFVLFDDVPLFWDAWDVMDYHLETRLPLSTVKRQATIVENSPTKVVLEFEKEISSKSWLKQRVVLRAFQPFLEFQTEIDWRECHKMLKVEFPVNVRANKATYECQFGHVERPNHRNTSWDSAKFEVCAQKWADLSEYGYGLALLNDGKYGYSCFDNVLTLSLLRSPKAPDAEADMGLHSFTYAVMPHFGSFQKPKACNNVIRCAYELNSPIRRIGASDVTGESAMTSLMDRSIFALSQTSDNVILESVKISECGRGVVVRLYESFGGKCSADFTSVFRFNEVHTCNILERKIDKLSIFDENLSPNVVRLSLKPFQILSLFLTFDFSYQF